MSLVLCNGGSAALLTQLVAWLNANAVLRLFQNNKVPAATDVAADYTEATFTGYAAQPIITFAAPVLTAPREITSAAPMLFTAGVIGTGNSIYGYYVTDLAGNLLWAERDTNAPILMTTTGDQYTIIPRFSLRSEF